MFEPRRWFVAGMIVYAIAMRITPYVLYQLGMSIDPETTLYPWNFSPMTALSLFGAAYYSQRRISYLVPFAALIVSDVLIGLLSGNFWFAIHPTTPLVYGSFALTIAMGMWLRKRKTILRVASTGLAAETIFFIATNFGVWAFQNTYPHDAAGLVACYVAALPFFGRSLVSTWFFSGVFFSRLAVTEREVVSVAHNPSVPAGA